MHSQFGNEKQTGSLAQLNRASDYGSEGCGFESRGSHKEKLKVASLFYSYQAKRKKMAQSKFSGGKQLCFAAQLKFSGGKHKF